MVALLAGVVFLLCGAPSARADYPSLAVTKMCPPFPVVPGGLFTFSGSVSNAGDVTLTNIVVVNNRPAPNTVVFGPLSLAPGASASFNGSYTAPVNSCSVSDTLIATATSIYGGMVTNTVSAACPILTSPSIQIAVSCPAAPTFPGGPLVHSGAVINTGNITLTNVTVVSDKPAPNTTVYTVSSLGPGASANFTSTNTAPLNTCSVTTTFSGVGQSLCDATRVTNTVAPTCPITTMPKFGVTLWCPYYQGIPGEPVTFTGTVTNSGNVTLANIVVTDNQAIPSTVLALASLPPGASAPFTASFTAPLDACTVSTTVTATGSDYCSGAGVTNSVMANCLLRTSPRIAVSKLCPPQGVLPGAQLFYTGGVTNTGNITLTNLIVSNNQPSSNTVVLGPISLAPGEGRGFSGSYMAPMDACFASDILAASGVNKCTGRGVTNTLTSDCLITTTPAIAIALACPQQPSVPGGQIIYSGTVSNSGNVTLINIAVTDSQALPNTVLTVPSLAPGVATNFTVSFTAPSDAGSVSSTATATGSVYCNGAAVTNNAMATCTLLTAPAPISLSFQTLSNQLVLSWTNAALGLQSAPVISGTFTNVPGATSPYTNPITGDQQYFRLISN